MRIGLGTAQFGADYGITNATGSVGRDEAAAILELAERSGIDTIDTASLYGDSEAVIGVAGAAGFRIVTKTPKFGASASEQEARHELRATFMRSLDKLDRVRVHGLLVHDPADLLGPFGPGLWREMEALKHDGLVAKLGGSFYEGEEIDRALDSFPLDLVQLLFNPLDQRLVEGGQLCRLNNAGVEVHARSLFLQGLLLAEPGHIPHRFAPVATAMADLRAIFAQAGLTAVEGIVALAFEQSEIDRFICGVTSAGELEAIIAAAGAAESGAARLPVYAPPELDPRLLNPARWDELA